MIIWISGPYGVGKSTLAEAMAAQMTNACIGEDEDCWCIENIEMAQKGASSLPGLHVPTDGRTVDELCEDLLTKIIKPEVSRN